MPAVVPACTRTMAVFEIFARERRELSNSEVARLLGVAETSCLDLLHTLVKCGYLTRTARTRRFYPTGRLLTISRQVSANDPLFAIANDALEMLTEQTGETGLCGRIQDGAVGIVALREGRHSLRYILNVGDRIAAYGSALGKALLAAIPEDEARALLARRPMKKLTEHTIVDVERFMVELATVRKRGWASVESEGNEGVSSLAVAGRVGEEMLAFAVTGPSARIESNSAIYAKALQGIKAEVFDGADSRVA